MTDIDTIARDRLDRRYPALAGEPDWDGMVEPLHRGGTGGVSALP
jgi:hypothetical protein